MKQASALPSRAELERALGSMILSASGWRAVFAQSGDEEDARAEVSPACLALAALAADAFADYLFERGGGGTPEVAVGTDTRPTGAALAGAALRALAGRGIRCAYLGIAAAPEIMAYARQKDGFVYISASHNPIGHNGIKFGLNDGGVLSKADAEPLIAAFREKCLRPNAAESALVSACPEAAFSRLMAERAAHKRDALAAYLAFVRRCVSGAADAAGQEAFFQKLRAGLSRKPLALAADLNGSARAASVDRAYFASIGVPFYPFNDTPGAIAHGIVPEGENLSHVARRVASLGADAPAARLGYMCDCDGDRGNLVYCDGEGGEARALDAQEGFALSVMAELACLFYQAGCDGSDESAAALARKLRPAVAVNGATSMRVDDIARAFGAAVFRAEVGEANVVNLAREKRAAGYAVPILGEGSNGGNITHPAAVRDPLATVSAVLKLLCIRGERGAASGPFHLWCLRSGAAFDPDFTLRGVLATLPRYATTGVSEERAKLRIAAEDPAALKAAFQREFEAYWAAEREALRRDFGFASYAALATNGTKETPCGADYAASGSGGLKIRFCGEDGEARAFMWMRGSGTEAVFRVLCDAKGDDGRAERALLGIERKLLQKAAGGNLTDRSAHRAFPVGNVRVL
jgi:phosphoglucomutase